VTALILTGEGPDLPDTDSPEWTTELQRLLQLLGHLSREPDGRWDDETGEAVKKFQESVSQAVDGRVTRETWLALDEQTRYLRPATSEDGQWVWDGERWVGASDGHPEPTSEHHEEVGQLSEDRQWRWDGASWQPATQ
jgi:hypothetical protein